MLKRCACRLAEEGRHRRTDTEQILTVRNHVTFFIVACRRTMGSKAKKRARAAEAAAAAATPAEADGPSDAEEEEEDEPAQQQPAPPAKRLRGADADAAVPPAWKNKEKPLVLCSRGIPGRCGRRPARRAPAPLMRIPPFHSCVSTERADARPDCSIFSLRHRGRTQPPRPAPHRRTRAHAASQVPPPDARPGAAAAALQEGREA